tara:strand:- start:1914 stop:2564 length:651 start_codon:yes stop_codon:yes gene_type:complete
MYKNEEKHSVSIEIISSYIPNIATMAFLSRQEKAVIQTDAFYQKQTYRNRTTIAGANGIINLSIPVNRSSKEVRLKDNEVSINYDEQWQNNHWKSFKSAYSSSPFFEYYENGLKEVFFTHKSNLIDFNTSLLYLFLEWCEIEVRISMSQEKVIFHPTTNMLISSKEVPPLAFPKYTQVFDNKFGFLPNLSILDLVSNLGPESSSYLNLIDISPMLE